MSNTTDSLPVKIGSVIHCDEALAHNREVAYSTHLGTDLGEDTLRSFSRLSCEVVAKMMPEVLEPKIFARLENKNYLKK